MMLATNGWTTDYHCNGMHIATSTGLVPRRLAKPLMHDGRQCDTMEWEADEVRKAVRTRRVYVQLRVPDVEQISSRGRRCDQ